MKKILIVVDYQKDFVDGALPVPGAVEIAKNIQNEINNIKYDTVIYTLDTHIKKDYEVSEEAQMFPEHCIFKTEGWNFYNIEPRNKDLVNQMKRIEYPLNLNMNEEFIFMKDKFSIWEGNKDYRNWFTEYFKDQETEIYICGVATNYCVFMNAIGYKEIDFNKVFIIENSIKGIQDESLEKNIEIMKESGIKFI